MEPLIIRPQAGPQEKFLSSNADIVIYGGSAGGGKSFSLLLDPLRYMNVEGYKAIIFRSNYNQIMAAGGLWDEAGKIYRNIPNAVPSKSPKAHWIFNGKASVAFDYITRDDDCYKWQGSQICGLCCEINTFVLMADGTKKKVKDIKIGDRVKTLTGVQTVTAVGIPQEKECVVEELPNGEKQIQTMNHKVLTKNGWISYEDCINEYDKPHSAISEIKQKLFPHRKDCKLGAMTINDVIVYDPTADFRKIRYTHPYTGEIQFSIPQRIALHSVELIPCGKKCVRSFTVLKDNHYITSCGLINKNCFDELTHFSEFQFFYMLSRNRSTCGVKPYVRATCNPDADSWVANFINWWIDQDTGYPIKERSGVKRYFTKAGDETTWGDSAEEVSEKSGVDPILCKSVTFIASSIMDNKALLKVDPSYLASLNALSYVERERLLNGNWKIKPAAGLYFPRDKAVIVHSIPDKIVSIARAWDLAATEINSTVKDPDRTCGVLMGRMRNGGYIILDGKRAAMNSADVRKLVLNTARQDFTVYKNRTISIPQDPGQAGKDQAASYCRLLAGYNLKSGVVSGNKIVRADPFSAQWQNGNVYILDGEWVPRFLDEMDGFPELLHDDYVDATSDAFRCVKLNADWKGVIS